MKKDLKSYIAHNKDFEGELGIESFRETKLNYEKSNLFGKQGFKRAVDKTVNKKLHIDIGSGSGWLLFKTSLLFEGVIGVEPSKTACDNVSVLIKEYGFKNISFVNSDMVDAVLALQLKVPVFLTTAIVLSHIKNSYVKQFLHLLDTDAIPLGSTLYFCERYDQNIQQNLWHIRRKYWWAKNLSNWKLEFFDIENTGYKSGIYGTKVGRTNIKTTFKPTFSENLAWYIDGLNQKKSRILRLLIKLIKK